MTNGKNTEQKKRITDEAARDIWKAVIEVLVSNYYNVFSGKPVIEFLLAELERLSELTGQRDSEDVLGLFLRESVDKHSAKREQLHGVASGQPAKAFTAAEQAEIWQTIKEGVIRGTFRTCKDVINAACVLRVGFVAAYAAESAALANAHLARLDPQGALSQESQSPCASGHREPASSSFPAQRTDPSLPREGFSD